MQRSTMEDFVPNANSPARPVKKNGGNRIIPALAALAILACAASLGAQQPPPPRRGPGGPGFGGGIGFVGFEVGFGRKVVTGWPFTATFTDTSTQTLPNSSGTIQHQSSGTLARDSQGRTYEQLTLAAIGPWAASGNPPQVIYISDPVAGVSYVLDPGKMTGRQFTLRVPSGNPPPQNQNRPPRNPPAGEQIATQALAQISVGGVNFDGTSEIRTIAANQIGNSSALQIIFNRWYSSNYQIVGETQRIDPRFGNTTFLLTGMQAGEPNAALFSAAGYTITQGKAGPRGGQPPPPPGP
jgi:hypothetical protein